LKKDQNENMIRKINGDERAGSQPKGLDGKSVQRQRAQILSEAVYFLSRPRCRTVAPNTLDGFSAKASAV